MTDTKISCDLCTQLFTRKSDLKRHMTRKHSVAEESFSPYSEQLTGINVGDGKTYTGRIVEMTAQDFVRGSWDYYLIKTDHDGDVIIRVERVGAA